MKVGNWHLAFGVAVAAMYLSGCAQDVPDIDRTQANKVKKALFQDDDEWYYQQTIVDTDNVGSAGGGYAFEAFQGSLYRIRWTITEDVLYAMSTVEPAEGLYDGQLDEDTRRIGVVAAFPIIQHFDVQRSYNSSTGEQSNVIVENGSDRLWWEREYMRVDWSTNLASTLIDNYAGQFAANGRDIPQSEDGVNPDRTRIAQDYIDTVTEYTYEPDLYACFTTLGYDTIFNCEAGPVQVRNSFKRIDKEKTYLPIQYTDNVYLDADGDSDTVKPLKTMSVYDPNVGKIFEVKCEDDNYARNFERDEFGYSTDDQCDEATFDMFRRFGYFRTERVSYDDGRGANQESQRMYYANRWNIWETMVDENGEPLPMEDRTPKPIVYYLNPEYPRDMYEPSQTVADQWNDAFLNTVAVAQGISVDEAKAKTPNGRMFEIRWNSCSAPKLQEWYDAYSPSGSDRMDVDEIVGEFKAEWGGDNLEAAVWNSTHDKRVELCAQLEYATEPRGDDTGFTWERVGDIRYSFFNWVDEEVPWLGYGPSSADPLTGEIIAGNANFAGSAIRRYGPYAADIVMYMNGDLDKDELIRGEHIKEYLAKTRREMREQKQELKPEQKRELAARAGLSVSDVSPTNFEERPSIEDLPHEFLVAPDKIRQDAHRNSLANAQAKASDTRMAEFFDKPTVRQFLMRDQNFKYLVESAAATKFGPDYDQADVDQAFVDVSTPGLMYAREQARNRQFMAENIMLATNMEDTMQSLVTYAGVNEYFNDKSREEIEKFFVEHMFVGTQLHEVGHTVGLRHNFSASMDAMNYHDEYWEIQKAIAKGEIDPDDRWSVPAGKVDAIGGGEFEYLNEAEFRLASVMDYTGDFTGRFAGLGKYDQAAINFAYGEVVEQWKSDDQLQSEFGVDGLNNFYGTELWLSDYTELPRIMAGAQGTGPAQDADTQLTGIDVIQNGREWVPLKQAREQRRQGILANTNNWKKGEFQAGTEPYIDRTVPYNFCTDDRAGATLGCDVFDFGANQREIVNHQFNTYRLFQPFRRYNRGRIYRLNENINYYAQWVYGILKAAENPFRYYSYYQWYDLGVYTDDLREASIDSINFYAELMATPEPGRYCLYSDTDTSDVSKYWWYGLDDVYVPARWDRNSGQCAQYIDIGKGDGQFFNYSFTNEYEYRVERVGSFVDKLYAALAMFEISGNYIDSSFFTDFRATNVSYWTLFRDEMLGFLRGTILGDYRGFAGVYNKQAGTYEQPKLIDAKSFGLGLPSDQEGMDRVYSPMSFSHEFNLLVGAMIYNTTWYDRHADFGQYVKLAVSTDESQPFPEETELYTFTHPETHQIYTAAQTEDGKSIAVELVDWANQLATRYEDAKSELENYETGTEDYRQANELVQFRSEQLEDVVAKMDMIRYVYEAMGPDALR
jgi:hypothetical protein